MFLNNPNGLIVYGLVLLLGILLGLFITAGGRKKWKTRYYDEVDRRKVLERDHAETLRERDRELADARKAAVAAPVVATRDPRDVNNDGVVSASEARPGIMDRMLGRDRDGDGVPDKNDAAPDDSSRA